MVLAEVMVNPVVGHQTNRHEPLAERNLAVFEDAADANRELFPARLALL